MRILITGPVGSGKTTQARILSQELHLKLVKTGELLREKMNKSPDIKKAMMQGDLVDDKLVAEVVKEKMGQDDDFIFDGYPRHMSQLEVFDPKIDLAVYIEISDTEAKKRLKKRGREDDAEEIVQERLKIYHQETEPLLKYFKKLNKLAVVDGHGSEKAVSKKIRNIFL